MLYTIGAQVISEKDGKPFSGIYVVGEYGLAGIKPNFSEIVKDKHNRIYLSEDVDTIRNMARYLSRLYRYEFRHRAKKLNTENSNFSIYVVKLPEKRFGVIEPVSKSNIKLDWGPNSQFAKEFQRIDKDKVHLCSIRVV